MMTKSQLIDSLCHECQIVKHLHGKLKPEQLDFRPAAGMRTTLETLRYLAACGIAPMKGALAENFEVMTAYFGEAANLTSEQIPTAMDKQAAGIREALAGIPEAEYDTRELSYPWGYKDKMGIALVNTSLKFMTAYRMQLFLYAKMSGSAELTTANCWAGMDMPPA